MSLLKKKDKNFLDLPSKEMGDYIFSLKDIKYNSEFVCDEDCIHFQYEKNKRLIRCRYSPVDVRNGKFSCIEVLLSIYCKPQAGVNWRIVNEDVFLIDSDKYSHKGMVLCDNTTDKRHLAKENDRVFSGTKADVVYLFPFLKKRTDIHSILINNGNQSIRFNISEESDDNDNEDSKNVYSNDNTYNSFRASYIRVRIIERINNLKVQMFRRLNTKMMATEAQRLEEKIETSIYSLSLELDSLGWNSPNNRSIYDSFHEEVTNYRKFLYAKKLANADLDVKVRKVSELMCVDPYVFEHICSKILIEHGFENVSVTPRSNDKGIDIMASKNGLSYAAQCKRYKGVVGSPEIQMFIGAMKNSNADKGIYITTGTFTKEAIIMADSNRIEMWDRNKLASLLTLDYDSEPDQPELFEDY